MLKPGGTRVGPPDHRASVRAPPCASALPHQRGNHGTDGPRRAILARSGHQADSDTKRRQTIRARSHGSSPSRARSRTRSQAASPPFCTRRRPDDHATPPGMHGNIFIVSPDSRKRSSCAMCDAGCVSSMSVRARAWITVGDRLSLRPSPAPAGLRPDARATFHTDSSHRGRGHGVSSKARRCQRRRVLQRSVSAGGWSTQRWRRLTLA